MRFAIVPMMLAAGAGGCPEPIASEQAAATGDGLCDRAAYLATTPAGEHLTLDERDQLARACGWCPAGEAVCVATTLVESTQAEFEARGRRVAVTLGWGDVDRIATRIEELGARLACADEATLCEARARAEAGEPFSPSCFHADFPPGTCVGDAMSPFGDLYFFEHTNTWLPPTASPCSCERPRCQRP